VDAYVGEKQADGGPWYDEMLHADRSIRPAWTEVAAGLAELGGTGLRRLRQQVNRMLDDDGVTYNPVDDVRAQPAPPAAPAHRGAPGQLFTLDVPVSRQRWKLDPVPLVLGAADWTPLEAAFRQRAVLLDLVLADLYGPRTLIRRGFIPPELVFGSRAYLRPAHGLTIPGAHQLFCFATDVFRAPSGEFLAIGDRTEAPAGAGYAMADRRVVSRVSPDVFRRTAPHTLNGFFRAFLHALQSVAPGAADDPRVVVLSPGTSSETAFDQAFLASLLGLPLVESEDLTVREGRLWMRALGRYEPVDVVLRRVDADYADPLDLRPDSQLGVVGMLEAARRGSVTVVNTIGSGILENPGLLPLLPSLAETLLGEPLRLPSVESFWCGDPTSLSHVRTHFADMVMRPTDPARRGVIVARLSKKAAAALLDEVVAQPQQWVGQPFASFSVTPSGGPDGLVGAQVGMRMFAVAQPSGYLTMPGGLGRVLPLNQQTLRASGLSEAKDVWIASGTAALAGDREVTPWVRDRPAVGGRATATSSPRALEDMFWLGRYTERAEALSRLLVATWERVEESRLRGMGQSDLVPVLLATVTHSSATYPGFVQGPVEVLPEMRSLLLDGWRLGSIAQSMWGLKEAASGVRDQLSRDTWLVLAGVDRALGELSRDPYDQGATLQAATTSVLSGMLALSGLAAENMIRDPGWYLMDVGRRLERGLQLVTVLRWAFRVPTSRSTENQLIESVLQFAESILTYRRRYRGRTQVATVLELLLLDVENPRSLAYQLGTMGEDLRALPDSSGTALPDRLLTDLVARLRRSDLSTLAKVDADGVRAELTAFLDGLHAELTALTDAVAAQRFRHPRPMQQLEHQLGGRLPGERWSA